MSGLVESRLTELGLKLPSVNKPVANYVGWVRSGSLLHVSGQLPVANGKIAFLGKLGADISIEEGYRAARLCALHLVAQIKDACEGDLDRVRRVVILNGFVNCGFDFIDHPKVMNGASDVIVEIFGEKGKHARVAVGAPSLPLGAAVEVAGVFEIE